MKFTQFKKWHVVIGLIVSLSLIGYILSYSNLEKEFVFLGLIFIGWGLYNIFAYFLNWKIYFGYGGDLKPDAHSQDRSIGLGVSIIGVLGLIIVMIMRLDI